MKNILYILLLVPCLAFGQGSRIASPMGGIVSLSPGTTITQASPTTVFYTETIAANTLMPTKWYRVKLHFKLTTPLIGVPGLSCTFQYGSQTFNLMSNSSLIGGITDGYFMIDFTMLSNGTNSQIPFAVILQPNGTLITLSASTATPVGAFTVDSTQDNNLTISLKFTGVSLGTSSLNNFWVYRDAF